MIKVFDFNINGQSGDIIGRPRELAWPCDMFRVTLPKVKRDGEREFNAFELCVLKLLACGRYDAQSLAQETCFPEDLIQVILLRLQDRAKIGPSLQLLDPTRKAIEALDTESATAPAEYETQVIFRECIGGTFLPMLKEANLTAEEISEDKAIPGAILIKKEGRNILPLWRLSVEQRNSSSPSPQNVLSALRTMAKRRKISGENYRIPPAEFVKVASKSEECFLRVRLVIQKNSTDWRILNPFGKGFSMELKTAYGRLLKQNKMEENEFKKWQNKNAGKHGLRQRHKGKPQAYETQENYNLYPELLSSLVRDDEGRSDVYAALEWALFYALQPFASKNVIYLLQMDKQEGSIESIDAAISALGLRPAKQRVAVPPEGKLRSFQDGGMAEMQVVLPLAILVSQDEPTFPFHKIAGEYPDFLQKIFDLKERRDAKGHGKNRWEDIYGEDDRTFMRGVVTTLLPSIRFSDSPPPAMDGEDTIADVRLNARLVLHEIFGITDFDRMDGNLQQALFQAEIFKQEHESDKQAFDALPCINYLYAAVQCAFRPLLKNGQRPENATIEYAAQKAREASFGELPEQLRHVRPEMVQKTLDGYDQTLGASVIAWLLLSEPELLQHVAEAMPTLLAHIGNLLTLRGHGNQLRQMAAADLKVFLTTIFKLIQTITEA